jgi:cytochrome c-type biogenesis protein CcmH
MTKKRFPLWTLLAVVLVVALVLGSGVLHSSPPTAAQRASAIEDVVRCPTCEDLSVAQSTAPTAITVRAAITQQIAAGRTDQQIKDYLEDRYGASIVLEPPASGWSLLVWLLPLIGGAIAVAAVAVVLIRRRKVLSDTTGPREADGQLSAEAAEDRRRFLTKSLADADAEYLAGDLSDKDYLTLRQRDMTRLAALEARPVTVAGALAERGSTAVAVDQRLDDTEMADADDSADPVVPLTTKKPTGRKARSKKSWFFLAGAVVSIAAALVVAVSLSASNRAPGQSATGSFAETPQQQIEETLAEAATLENSGDLGQAASDYQSVLKSHPDNEVAVAQLGWLEYELGQSGKSASLIADARVKLNRAVALDPDDYAARLYLGTLLLQQDGNAAGAVAQYQKFLANSPPASLLKQAAPELRQAYQEAGVALPTQVSAT